MAGGGLVDGAGLEVLAAGEIDVVITGCYISDLLSLAMSRVGEGNAWVTVQTNINVVAVAALSDAACVVIAEGMDVPQEVRDKAAAQGVNLLRTGKTAYEMAKIL